MQAPLGVGVHYLWHPGTRDRFSGYGLFVAPGRLVGIIMDDRPTVADPTWLAEIERTFGRYQLAAMTPTGERGMVGPMEVAEGSRQYLRCMVHPLNRVIRDALRSHRRQLPIVTLEVRDAAEASEPGERPAGQCLGVCLDQ